MLLVVLLARAFELVDMWLREIIGRATGAYRTGYAHVPNDADFAPGRCIPTGGPI